MSKLFNFFEFKKIPSCVNTCNSGCYLTYSTFLSDLFSVFSEYQFDDSSISIKKNSAIYLLFSSSPSILLLHYLTII